MSYSVYNMFSFWVKISESSSQEEELQPAAFEKNYLVLCIV